MSRQVKNKMKEFSDNIDSEHMEKSISRCYNMLDYISDSAANIVTDIIYNSSCLNAKQFLVLRPEELAVKAFRKVLEDFNNVRYKAKDVH